MYENNRCSILFHWFKRAVTLLERHARAGFHRSRYAEEPGGQEENYPAPWQPPSPPSQRCLASRRWLVRLRHVCTSQTISAVATASAIGPPKIGPSAQNGTSKDSQLES